MKQKPKTLTYKSRQNSREAGGQERAPESTAQVIPTFQITVTSNINLGKDVAYNSQQDLMPSPHRCSHQFGKFMNRKPLHEH